VFFAVNVVNPLPASVTELSNIASIGDDGANGDDPTPSDNTTAPELTPIDAAPDLQIDKSDGGISVDPGGTITYTLTITNTGDQDATGVVVTDTVPADTTFDPVASSGGWVCSPDTSAGSVCTHSLGSIAGGSGTSTAIFALSVDDPVLGTTTAVTNTALVGDDGSNGVDPNPGDNVGQDVTPINFRPPVLSIDDRTGDEGVGIVTFTVTLDGVSVRDASIGYVTYDGTATTGSDYTAVAGTLVIPAGSVTGTIAVTIFDDALDEDNETFTVTLSTPVNVIIGDGEGIGTIMDDDPLPEVSLADFEVSEDAGAATVVVSLSTPSGLDVSLDYVTSDSTATAGTDYVAASGTLTIAAGETTANIVVPIVNDDVYEETETFVVSLLSPNNATIIDHSGVVTITDADTVHVFLPFIARNHAPAPDLVVTDITATSDSVQVVVENQGSMATASAFWVDVYVDPHPVPTGVNQVWSALAVEGLVWGVDVLIAAGETLTLTYGDAFFAAERSNFGESLALGTPVYAQVDSAHAGTAYGGVLETHEMTGGLYNNIAVTSSTAGVLASAGLSLLDGEYTRLSGSLPLRR
jgi:uncharacterized repeat protein (TIGR01451 family)